MSNYYNPKLLNGINLCAFAAMMFVTYLLLGTRILKFLSFLYEFPVVAKCVYLLAAIGTLVLAFLSLCDAYKAKQGKVKEISGLLSQDRHEIMHTVVTE